MKKYLWFSFAALLTASIDGAENQRRVVDLYFKNTTTNTVQYHNGHHHFRRRKTLDLAPGDIAIIPSGDMLGGLLGEYKPSCPAFWVDEAQRVQPRIAIPDADKGIWLLSHDGSLRIDFQPCSAREREREILDVNTRKNTRMLEGALAQLATTTARIKTLDPKSLTTGTIAHVTALLNACAPFQPQPVEGAAGAGAGAGLADDRKGS